MLDINSTLSEKAKEYLTQRLQYSTKKIKKLKQKRTIIKIIYYTLTISSISISAIIASLCGVMGISPIVITVLSTTSGILTGLSIKFNLQGKKDEMNKTIEKLHKIEAKLEHVVSCNRNFSKEDFDQLLNDY